jgi:hypothetical protein
LAKSGFVGKNKNGRRTADVTNYFVATLIFIVINTNTVLQGNGQKMIDLC